MNELFKTAIHEAAHAFTCLHYAIRFKHATIVPGDNSLGHVLLHRYCERFKDKGDAELTAKDEQNIKRLLCVSLAGGIAEYIHLKGDCRKDIINGMGNDMEAIRSLLCRVAYTDKGQKLYLLHLQEITMYSLIENWGYVLKIALGLMRGKRLSEKECRQFYNPTKTNYGKEKPPCEVLTIEQFIKELRKHNTGEILRTITNNGDVCYMPLGTNLQSIELAELLKTDDILTI